MLTLLALFSSSPAQEPTDVPATGEELPIVKGPSVLEYVEAEWPAGAKEAGLEAVVTLRIELDASGEVGGVEVLEPAGHGFDEAAVDAILSMRFAPAETEAGPVPVVFDFAYGFEMVEEPEPERPAPVNLEGRIREKGTRVPIEGATVVVDGTDLTARTDNEGRFSIRGAPLGAVTVRILEPDHVTLDRTVDVVEGEATVLELWMLSTSYRDNEIVGVYERKREEVTRRTVTIDEVRRIPGTFGDPVKVVQTLPGAARSPFGTGLLVIRGSNPEDSGVYVDGVRIPLIYHLTGTTSVLSPEIIQSVDYLPGGYGVQYGRSTGGVVDVKTKDELSEQPKLVWGTDILDSQIWFEGQLPRKDESKPRHQVALGARRSYVDAFIPYFTRGQTFSISPKYWDYQVKYIAPMPEGQHLSAFFYGFSDVLRVSTDEDQAQGSDADTQGDLQTVYGSNRLVMTYRNAITEKLDLAITPSIGLDATDFGLGDAFTLANDQLVSSLRAELRYRPTGAIELAPGVEILHGTYRFDFRSATNFEDVGDPLAEREPVGFDGRGTFFSPDLYLKVNLRPLGGSDRWLLTPGIRGQMYGLSSKGSVANEETLRVFNTAIDPRVHTRFEIADGHTLKASTGLYSQPPQPQEALGVGRASDVGYETTWATSIGFEQQLTPAVRWDVDLFYKDFRDLVVFNEAYDGFGVNDAFVNAGDGRAYGMELIARHDPAGRFFGWVSYTLSRAERRDGPEEEPYLFDFDQTHIFSAQAGYDLPHDFGISAQVQAVTGNPDTPLNAGIYDVDADFYNGFAVGERNTTRLPMFFQTSLRADKLFTFKSWQLEAYVDLLNAVRGVNPEFRVYAYDYSDSAFVRGLPFIPNVGLEARFWL